MDYNLEILIYHMVNLLSSKYHKAVLLINFLTLLVDYLKKYMHDQLSKSNQSASVPSWIACLSVCSQPQANKEYMFICY